VSDTPKEEGIGRSVAPKHNRIRQFTAFILCVYFLFGCVSVPYEYSYRSDRAISSFRISGKQKPGIAKPFAENLCITLHDTMPETVDTSKASSVLLCDVARREVLYSKNAHQRLHPASLTKIMTAWVAIKYGDFGRTLIATDTVKIQEAGAQLIGIKSGDTMTMDQALHMLLMYSANDVAMMIAENVGQTVEHFIEMMNEEAKLLGATNTHFSNPHGLTQDDHYSTAYDLYLIFNAAIANDSFKEIIHMANYQTVYYDLSQDAKELSFRTTNQFLNGNVEPPTNVTVIGGKTGTTNAAGHCLILLSKDANGDPYISVILNAETRDDLYSQMDDLLESLI
jgi:D-alanyl-D-alanine carboxypeptidase